VIVLVCRFVDAGPDFLASARPAVALLAGQPTCRSARLARSTDDAAVWTLTADFDSVPGYRRALSPFEVRTTVIPFLSTADQLTSGVFEVAVSADAGVVISHDLLVEP
jgi:hypothetical protein